MMMKIKHFMALAILSPLTSYFSPLMMCAQEKNLFTLEELNFGGKRYQALQPENQRYAWWGDELVRIDKERCFLVDKKTGKDIRPLTDDENNKRKGGAKATTIIKDHQLYVVDAQGKEDELTIDGSREIVYGQSVHRNEFGINKGTFWSPDGQRLAFYRMDQSMVTDYPQVNIFPREATYEPDKYPMAGMTSHIVTIGVYDINTEKAIYLITPNIIKGGNALAPVYFPLKSDSPTDSVCYFTNIAWSPDSKTIYIFELNRDQNDCRLVSYDAETGLPLGELYRETSDKYVEPLHPIQFLPWDSDKFIMQSQRDGYNHLYLYNKEGTLLKQLTSGPWVVQNVLGFNAKQKSIIFEANKYHPLHRQIYSVNVNNGKMTQLTTDDGIHHGELSASGAFLIDRHSSPTQPRNISVIDISNGKTAKATRLFTASDPWEGYEQPIFECGIPHGEALQLRRQQEISHRGVCLWRSSRP